MASLLKVFHTGGSKDEDYHRFKCLEKVDSYDKVGRLIQGCFCSLHHTLKKCCDLCFSTIFFFNNKLIDHVLFLLKEFHQDVPRIRC